MKLNLALYKRAILTDSRKFVLYGAWLLMGGFLFIQLWDFAESSSMGRRFSGASGLRFLETIAYTNFFFITLLGVLGFSSSITEEKEEDCLGLLIMTGISPINLLVSKTLARYSRGVFLVLSQIPFIVLTVTLGGVSLDQVITVYTILFSYMFALCCMGTLFSLFFTTTGKASAAIFILLFFYLITLLIIADINYIDLEDMVYLLPFVAIEKALNTAFSGYYIPEQFFPCLLLGLFCFMLSIISFDKYALRKPVNKVTKVKFKLFQRGRVWTNALFWKEFSFNLAGRKGWFIQCMIYLLLALFLSVYLQDSFSRDEAIVGFLAGTSLIFSSVILAVCASNMFSSEFREGTHTSLFTLPTEVSHIFVDKVLGALLYAVPSILVMVFSFLYLFKSDSPELEGVLCVLSFLFIYIVLSGYLGLVMRIGAFVASAALIFMAWVMLGSLFFRGIGDSSSVVALILFVNTAASAAIFVLARNKLDSMISR